MTFFNTVGVGPIGFTPGNHDARCYNRTGGTRLVGDVVMVDTAQSDEAVTTAEFGGPGSLWATCVVPTNTRDQQTRYGFFGVVVDLLDGAGADDTEMLVRFAGTAEIAVSSATTAAAGDRVSITGTGSSVTAVADSDAVSAGPTIGKGIGYCLEDASSAGADRVLCVFDGIYGLMQGFGTT